MLCLCLAGLVTVTVTGVCCEQVVGVGKNYIDIMSVDMVDGTPVLDVKPYTPHDIVPHDRRIEMAALDGDTGLPLAPSPLRVPAWIYEADVPLRAVRFSEAALGALSLLQDSQRFLHCTGKEDAMRLVREVLRQDIRGLSLRGRGEDEGEAGGEQRGGGAVGEAAAAVALYECKLDAFTVKFRTLRESILVEAVLF